MPPTIFQKIYSNQPKYELIDGILYLSIWKIKIKMPLKKNVFLITIKANPSTHKIGVSYKETSPNRETWTENSHTYTSIDSAHIDSLNDNCSAKIVNCLNEQHSKIPLWPISLPLCILGYKFIIIAILLSSFIYFFYDKLKTKTFIFYTIYENFETKKITLFFDSLQKLNRCFKLNHIWADAPAIKEDIIQKPFYKKFNFNIHTTKLAKQYVTKVVQLIPKQIISNVNFQKINFGKQDFFFLPDRIIIFDKDLQKFGSISYNNVKIHVDQIHMKSEEEISDAKLIDETWKYIKKDGTKDNRYKNKNHKIYLYEMFRIYICSDSGIYEVLLASNNEYANNFVNAFNELKKVL
jgi:hypothetical protein